VPHFSAALLVGGHSRRMGRDKAMLLVGSPPQPLWRRQWALLQELEPAEMRLSRRKDQADLSEQYDVISVEDTRENAGPLAGIAAVLASRVTSPTLVLAVDMPEMTTAPLAALLAASTPECGAVFFVGSFAEPLAAVYPSSMLALAERRLLAGQFALQGWVKEGVECGLLQALELPREWLGQFRNWNSPDLAPDP
jgi:molybdopterin-guanine dinucleotide biosynthesis protein A